MWRASCRRLWTSIFPRSQVHPEYSAIPWAAMARSPWRCATRNSTSRFRHLRRLRRPRNAPWGRKAFSNYFGAETQIWREHDATELVARRAYPGPILIDQGTADQYLAEQLLPEKFAAAAARSGQRLNLRMQQGYDHGYYFIQTFMADHLRHHAEQLGSPAIDRGALTSNIHASRKVPARDLNWNAVKYRGCPRNCNRRANVHDPLKLPALGRGTGATTREPGHPPRAVVLLPAGVR